MPVKRQSPASQRPVSASRPSKCAMCKMGRCDRGGEGGTFVFVSFSQTLKRSMSCSMRFRASIRGCLSLTKSPAIHVLICSRNLGPVGEAVSRSGRENVGGGGDLQIELIAATCSSSSSSATVPLATTTREAAADFPCSTFTVHTSGGVGDRRQACESPPSIRRGARTQPPRLSLKAERERERWREV